MKKIAISSMLILCVATMLFGACGNKYKDPWRLKQEDQGFYYYLVGDDGYPSDITHKGTGAVILGLSGTKSYIDELIIPERLGGYPVVQIGEQHAPIGYTKVYGIEACNIKKIVINHSITLMDCGIQHFYGDLIINSRLINFYFTYYQNENSDYINGLSLSGANSLQFNFDIVKDFESFEFFDYLLNDGVEHYQVIYDVKEGQCKTFATINKENNLLPEPEEPTKDGYVFDGWYADEGYETQWNFEKDAVTENITLYAKWIKN